MTTSSALLLYHVRIGREALAAQKAKDDYLRRHMAGTLLFS